MKRIKMVLFVEFIKLFRHSNVLFIFLVVYLYITPIAELYRDSNSLGGSMFEYVSRLMSIVSLLIMALFFVNSAGNDFTEGSYRKSIAIGLGKNYYLFGKLLLIVFFSTMIFLINLSVYFLLGLLHSNMSLESLTNEISFFAIINQLLSLFTAGLFGFFFIAVFRNRVIGLVFFPFWLSIEFTIKLVERMKDSVLISKYTPGNSAFSLYNSHYSNLECLFVVIIINVLFVISIWLALKLREERGKQIQ